MSDPLIGQQLASYRIEHLIGRGGMASVYYGWDARLQRPVAVKVADASREDIAYARRLVHEARMMARWRHPNVIQVYYADQQAALYFFAMEYVDGLDLGDVLARYAAIGQLVPHDDVLRVAQAVASALDYAHGQGVIHRDVKPSNVLLALDGRIILSDFGLALDVQQGTLGEALGTPHYIAPEQARDSASTVPQSDLYSLGVILYEMLTGRVPFDDPSPMSLALKHITDLPPLPTSLNPAVSIPVEAVLLKALSKDPHDRYPSATLMIDALERSLALPAPGQGGDPRLVLPLADVLAEVGASRATFPAHPSSSDRPTPAPTRSDGRAAARRRTSTLLALGGLALAVLVIAGLVVAALPRLAAGPPPPIVIQTEPPQPGAVQTSAPPAVLPQNVAPETETAAVTDTPGLPGPAITQPATEVAAQPTTPLVGVAPTILYPAGHLARLVYTERGFYFINPGDTPIQVGPLTFEALDAASGAPAAYRFDSVAWAQHFPMIERGKCDAIEIRLTSAFVLRPKDCDGSNFNALVTPESTSSELFWLARQNVEQFRVLWDGQEIARCAAGSGSCDVYLP